MDIIQFLQTFSNPFLDKFFELITILGEESIYIIFLGIIFWCFDKKFGYKLAFIFLFSSVANCAVKNIFKAPRPIGIEGTRSLRVETATGYSFPSGHTQATAVFWTSIIMKYRKTVLYVIGTFTVMLVGISRMYLGVHWPKDVAIGIVFGIVCSVIGSMLFDYSQKTYNKTILLIIVIPAVIGLFFWGNSEDYIKSAAVLCSFFVGYVIEDNYIGFTENAPLSTQLLKFFIGITGILVIKIFVKELLPINEIGYFIRYFLIGIWTTVCAPLLFLSFKLTSCKNESRRIAA
jgi:membrane-associated phospholipid phosphatase